jgi:hypothetical protein
MALSIQLPHDLDPRASLQVESKALKMMWASTWLTIRKNRPSNGSKLKRIFRYSPPMALIICRGTHRGLSLF